METKREYGMGRTRILNARVSPETWDKFAAVADKLNAPKSIIMRELILDFIERETANDQPAVIG
jgi:predicted transcriptional regulator